MTSSVNKLPYGRAIFDKGNWTGHYTFFLETTDRQERLKEWMDREFKSKVADSLRESLASGIGVDEPLRFLGVGSAEGYQEIVQLKALQKRFNNISAQVVEPTTEYIEKYKETVHQSEGDFDGIEYEWYNQTFVDYVRGKESVKQKFHVISLVHSVYYVWDKDLEETIRELYGMLEPGGMLFLIAFTGHTSICALHAFTDALTNDGSTPSTNIVTTDDVKIVLDKNKIPYTQSEYTETTDITSCITDEDSAIAKQIMCMLTCRWVHPPYPRDLFNKVMGYIKDHVRVTKCEHTGGERYLYDSVCDILVITKDDK